MSKIIYVPLSALSLSSRNARKTGGGDVADLAANIAASGLIQNLLVTPGERGHEVIAGGRRLSALQLLEREGRLPSEILTDGVPCRVITDEAAILEASTAENTIRVPMHPADQFAAFQAMIGAGKTVDDVAAHFGTTELVVRRRLRLANVAPELLAEYRADRATLEQITALALTEDHDAQRRAWAAGEQMTWKRNPQQLREALTEKQISSRDPRVRFVGLAAYEAAGGTVIRDLFDDAGGGYVQDAALLDRLVDEKLKAEAEALKAEGWAFVRVDDADGAWKFRNGCGTSQPKRVQRELDVADAARLQSLKARKAALDAALEAAEMADEDVFEDDPRLAELQGIEDEIETLSADVEIYTDRQKAKAGCQLVLDRYSGQLEIHRGLIPSTGKAQDQAAAAVAANNGEKAPAKTPELAESMVRRLTAHKTIALQTGLIANANVALAVLANALLGGIWFNANGTDAVALHVRADKQLDGLDRLAFDDVTNSPHYRANLAALEQLRATLKVPERREALLPWLLSQSRDVVVSLLASVPAYTVNAVAGAVDRHPSDKVLEALDLDLADYWQPTAATFFGQVPKSLGLQAVTEALGAKDPKVAQLEAAALKKDEFAGHCEQLLQRRGWLPKPLRRPGYRLRTDKAGPTEAPVKKPEKAKPSAKPAAKKATSKPAKKASKAAAKKTPKKAPAKKKTARK